MYCNSLSLISATNVTDGFHLTRKEILKLQLQGVHILSASISQYFSDPSELYAIASYPKRKNCIIEENIELAFSKVIEGTRDYLTGT